MKHYYHIRCDPDLNKGFCAMRHITGACTGCVEQLPNPWLPNLDKNLQTRYAIKTETCKYPSILRGYNKWYIFQIDLKIKKNPDEMEIKGDLVLNGMTWAASDNTE